MNRHYLVYKVTNRFNGKIYIGVHSTLNKNDRYMGSGTEIRKAIKKEGRKSFVKEILFTFDTREEMLSKEKELVTKEFCLREDTYNCIIGGGYYDTHEMVVVKDKEGQIYKIYKEDPRYLSGEFVGIAKGIPYNKGKLNVRDADGNTFQVDVTDPRYLSGELVHTSTGKKQHYNQSWLGKNHSEDAKQKIGLANSVKQKGESNSQFGTCWVTNGIENKKIKKEQLEVYIIDGFYKGRI